MARRRAGAVRVDRDQPVDLILRDGRPIPNCSYKTDAEGNVVRRYGALCAAPLDTLLWTVEGQLDSLKIGSTGVKFLYDAFGRLTGKRVNGAVQAYFLWDGDQLLAQLTSAGTAVVTEYSYYPGLDQPHALIKQPAGSRFYARLDGLGNVIALTNEANQVRRTYTYDYWGKSTGGTDTEGFSGADRARWKGALWLGAEADLYYMRNRWYEPATGRFLSEDPIGLQGGINPAVFAGNDPINGADPFGLSECIMYGNHVYKWDSSKNRWIWLYDEITSVVCDRPATNPGEKTRQGEGGSGVRRTPFATRLVTAEVEQSTGQCLARNTNWLGKDVAEGLAILGVGTTGGLLAGGGVARAHAMNRPGFLGDSVS